MQRNRLLALFLLAALTIPAQSEQRLPAVAAYLQPDAGPAQVSPRSTIADWTDPAQKLLWWASLRQPGRLDCSVVIELPAGTQSKLRLTVEGVSHETVVSGATHEVIAALGTFDVATNGYQRFTLESLNPRGQSAGNIAALILDGPAAAGAAFFRTQEQRSAPSTHLFYTLPPGEKIEAFYCEVVGVLDPVPSYYMACGWHRGYFGMQVNSSTERRIIFSVWDSGNEAEDRRRVADADRVTLVAKGENVISGDFGHEGTGGHSHLVYHWKTGEKQKFIVTAKPVDATHTIYSGYWFHPEKQTWMLISSWKAPQDGGYMRGLYSFTEDFGGTGWLRRKALFGNQWVRNPQEKWFELTSASFGHTGKDERLDRCMGVENGQFFLAAGAFMPGTTESGTRTNRPALGKAPLDLALPPLPE